MSFDRAIVAAAIAEHGPVVRVVVADTRGSVPREAGAAMLVWGTGQSGTIGGGALEYDAVAQARVQLRDGMAQRVQTIPLGPALGQCCGGAVTLLNEVHSRDSLPEGPVFARPVGGVQSDIPLAVHRVVQAARSGAAVPAPGLVEGWMIEPVQPVAAALWIYGAGHVGRALVNTLAPLPEFAVTWVDSAPDRFPENVPNGVRVLPAANPADAAKMAPNDAHHLILTYSHALDLELCHQLLIHGFASAGLIGSATKWARFRSRLAALGHENAQISRICCPIGRPELGKHPQAIAVGVAAELILSVRSKETAIKTAGGMSP